MVRFLGLKSLVFEHIVCAHEKKNLKTVHSAASSHLIERSDKELAFLTTKIGYNELS